ncbi:mitochondrial outer membrane import complex protein METAXIN-like [Populus alba x Populus x berolinensis]|nr:mitochondrial outer membrane import complex protein METAXIN-like [Populus alba x Populus x berolinensis]
MLRSALLELKTDFLEAGSSSSVPQFLSDASLTSTRCPSNSGKIDLFIFYSCECYIGSKPKKQPKRERTEKEKTFRRRAGHFLVTQVVAVLVFLSVMSSNDFSEVESLHLLLHQPPPSPYFCLIQLTTLLQISLNRLGSCVDRLFAAVHR